MDRKDKEKELVKILRELGLIGGQYFGNVTIHLQNSNIMMYDKKETIKF